MENFQRSSALPMIKYNFVVLFLSQLYYLFIYASKYFLIDHHYKGMSEFIISSQMAKFIDVPAGCWRLIHTDWWQWQQYRSPCEHPLLFALNPFMTTALSLPQQCEHPYLIALNPFMTENIQIFRCRCRSVWTNLDLLQSVHHLDIICYLWIFLFSYNIFDQWVTLS